MQEPEVYELFENCSGGSLPGVVYPFYHGFCSYGWGDIDKEY